MSIVQSIVGIVVASVNSQTTVYNNRQRVPQSRTEYREHPKAS